MNISISNPAENPIRIVEFEEFGPDKEADIFIKENISNTEYRNDILIHFFSKAFQENFEDNEQTLELFIKSIPIKFMDDDDLVIKLSNYLKTYLKKYRKIVEISDCKKILIQINEGKYISEAIQNI